MISADAEKQGRQTGLTEHSLPEKSWPLIVLATLNP
jgi:hypothetical protein